MGACHILLVFATVGALLPSTASVELFKSLSNVAGAALDNLDPQFYTVKNAIKIHYQCYTWCWTLIFKKNRDQCYINKEDSCKKLKNFSYKLFFLRWGAGKAGTTAMNAPVNVVGAAGMGAMAVGGMVGEGGKKVLGTTGEVVTGGAEMATKAFGAPFQLVKTGSKMFGGGRRK